ncbi:hypothetical protein [Nannocystis pusilla]|uniref:hypothetical protein n=1 Tax=Nannocystis pusilla TaxID=889268 RepID=UPI003B8171FD
MRLGEALGQAGLAHAAEPGDSHELRAVFEAPGDGVEIGDAPDERGRDDGHIRR